MDENPLTGYKLLLVDGHNLLFQMYFGMPSRIVDKSGRQVHGILGFLAALRKMASQVAPTHMCVIFDGETPNPRREADPLYKANRPTWDGEDDPFGQLPGIYAGLDAWGICHGETVGEEADDAIAACARAWERQGGTCVIASHDSDYFQLLSPRISILRYRGEASRRITEETFRADFGIPPAQYVDWKCLVGDTADNIPGLPGVGPKTAAALLCAAGSLGALLDEPERAGKARWAALIRENRDRLCLSRRLITLGGAEEAAPGETRENVPDGRVGRAGAQEMEFSFPSENAAMLMHRLSLL